MCARNWTVIGQFLQLPEVKVKSEMLIIEGRGGQILMWLVNYLLCSSVTFGFLLVLMLTMTMIINWGSTQLIDNIDNVENDVDHESNKLGESTQLIDNGWAEWLTIGHWLLTRLFSALLWSMIMMIMVMMVTRTWGISQFSTNESVQAYSDQVSHKIHWA